MFFVSVLLSVEVVAVWVTLLSAVELEFCLMKSIATASKAFFFILLTAFFLSGCQSHYQFDDGPGEWAEGLLVIDKIECPGLVILRNSALELVPIIGKPCLLSFGQINAFKEGRWLPGKFVWGKRAFNFDTPIRKRLAFAVAESIGARWSAVLPDRKIE